MRLDFLRVGAKLELALAAAAGSCDQMTRCNCLFRTPKWQNLKATFTIKRYSSFDIKRQSKIMKKLMTGSKKNWYKNPEKFVKVQPGSLQSLTPPNVNNRHRISVLNTVLIKAISEVMSTGEVGEELIENNIEITRVKVAQDFNTVNVYWYSAEGIKHNAIEQLLHENAWKFRSELCSRQVLGNVPHIIFVKDKEHIKGKEVLNLLNKLDLGDESETVKTSKPDIFNSKLEKMTLAEVVNGEKEPSVVDGETLCAIAPCLGPTEFPTDMKLDIYGLDYKSVMKSLVKKMNQAQGTHRTTANVNEENVAIVDKDNEPQVERHLNTEFADIKDFLRERKIEMKKKLKYEKQSVENEPVVNEDEPECFFDDRVLDEYHSDDDIR